MARKARHAPPWTRKKLFAYRSKRRKQREAERKAQKQLLASLDKSRARIDAAMKGVHE